MNLRIISTAFLAAVALSGCATGRDAHERLTGALWMQTSAEFWADSEAKYRLAATQLDRALADKAWTAALEQKDNFANKPVAVIMDLDETVLDNSRFQGELAIERGPYKPDVWSQWVAKSDATAIPGALAFIKYAQSKGATVFFVTNRTTAEEAATRANLVNLGISLPATDTVFTRAEKPEWDSSDKGTRRMAVADGYRIALLVGDDLGDFVTGSKDTPEKRVILAQQNGGKWGERWILIANPLYGSWEAALYDHDNAKPDEEVLKRKFDKVRGFN